MKKITLDSLTKESEKVLSVFKRTVENLRSVRDRSLVESEIRTSAAKKLSEEAKQLENLAEESNKIANKIENLLV